MKPFDWQFPYPSQRMPILARNVVATSQPLAAQAGLRMLIKGGSAVDAVLAVVQDGAIQITFGNSASGVINGKILTLRPAVVEDAPIVPVAWVCGNANPPEKMTVKGENRTDIPVNYLPLNCRSLVR